MKKYCVEAIYYPNKDFSVTIQCSSFISNTEAVGVIYFSKIITRKYFSNYSEVVKYVTNTDFEEMCYNFIQLHDLYDLASKSDYKTICRKLVNRGFIEYYTEVSDTTTNYFKKEIENDFTQYISVRTVDGEGFSIDSELFDLVKRID